MRKNKRILAALLASLLAGCTASQSASPSVPAGNRFSPFEPPVGSLHWMSGSGLGIGQAQCGSSWVAIVGGAYSAKATDVGTGYPDPNDPSQWDALSPSSYDLTTSYAMCAPSYALSSYFYRNVGTPTKKTPKAATALCFAGDMLIEGWGSNATFEGAVLKSGKPAGWIAGGSTSVVAYAECARASEVTANGLSTVPRSGSNMTIACDGDNDDVLSGFFGVATTGGGPPPPERSYPSLNGLGSTQPTSWTFLDKSSSTAWVVCQED